MPSPTPRQRWVLWALGAYALAAVLLLLSPIGPSRVIGAFTDWVREDLGFTAFRQGWIEAPANVLLFIPLGLLLTLLFRHPWIGVALAVLLSIGAEVAQIVLPSRVPSIRDVIANALGAGIGALLAWAFIAARRRRERQKATTRAR